MLRKKSVLKKNGFTFMSTLGMVLLICINVEVTIP